MPGVSVRLKDITVVFNAGTPNEVTALDNINLEIAPGEIVIIQGGNGSGKSTMLKVIAGIIKPNKGTIYINEQDVTHSKDYHRMQNIGFIHQDPLMGTCPSLTLFENMILAGKNRWWWPLPYRLSLPLHQIFTIESIGLGLEKRLSIPLTNFSGGQRQALTSASVFSRQSPLILLDEFTSSLDENTSEKIIHMALQVPKGSGATVLMIMHDTQRALSLKKRIVTFEKGRLK